MRFFLIFFTLVLGFIYTGPAQSQVVTAPYSVSHRLMNPAAAVTRQYRSFALGLENNLEKAEVLNLQNSSITEEITINQALVHGAWIWWKKAYFELDIAFQSGEKTKKNIYSSSGVETTQTNEDSLNLVPLQILVGKKLSPSFNGGLKFLTTMANVKTNNNYRNGSDGATTTVAERNKLDARLFVGGVGLTYNLSSNFAISYAADFNQFRFVRDIQGTSSTTTSGNTSSAQTTNLQSTVATTVRRDIAGIGFSAGTPRSSAFRSEISYERIAPLEERDDLKEGRLMRATAETQLAFFHVGVEYTSRQGYMLDSYNLIPFFFKFEKFSNVATKDYGFFGGFKSAKGHSIGGSINFSNETVKEQLSKSDPTLYDVERSTQTIGINYSYVF